MTMQKFADHIITIANDENIIVTNLHLQKVMYFTLKKGIEQKRFQTMIFIIYMMKNLKYGLMSRLFFLNIIVLKDFQPHQ